MMARSISHFLFVKRMKILGGNHALLSGSPIKLKLLLRNFEMIFKESFLKKIHYATDDKSVFIGIGPGSINGV